MRKLLQAISFIVSLTFLVSNAYGKEYVIGVETLEYRPHYYTSSTGSFSGFSREVLDHFAEKMNVKLTFKSYNPDELWTAFFNGEVDARYPDNPYWYASGKKGKDIKYSNDLVKALDGVIVKRENESMTEIKTLVMPKGFTPYLFEKDIKAGKIKVMEKDGFKETLKTVLRGEADGAFMNIAVAHYYAIKIGRSALKFNKNLPNNDSSYHLATIKKHDLIDKFNEYLAKNQDWLYKMKAKHKVEVDKNTI